MPPLLPLTFAGLAFAGLAASSAHAESAPELPRLGTEPAATSVVGVSSGGYMATQLAVAWPERFAGLGVLAAGPWACSQGTLRRALGQCMTSRLGPPDVGELEARHRDYRERALVGDAEDLARLRVFVWHGDEDETVVPALGRLLADQFRAWLTAPEAQLRLLESENVGHGWPVGHRADQPAMELANCRSGGGTHLLACDLDLAGELLNWLHGGLAPPFDTAAAGRLLRFDQAALSGAKGLDDEGFLFVPDGCEAGGCGLTMALHGCGMGAEQIGEVFVRHSGLNDWAATNQRVVLYPQAKASMANPLGCWDWWGFAESTWQPSPLHDSRQGLQAQTLMNMIDRLEAAPDAP